MDEAEILKGTANYYRVLRTKKLPTCFDYPYLHKLNESLNSGSSIAYNSWNIIEQAETIKKFNETLKQIKKLILAVYYQELYNWMEINLAESYRTFMFNKNGFIAEEQRSVFFDKYIKILDLY